ncbi:MAG TPA: hypothetical protein VFS62_13345, partial [Chloroflexota bacterium]|nr:hypothetical protein [Chloroflexota bacterium]
MQQVISRREFVRVGALGLTAFMAACGTSAPASPASSGSAAASAANVAASTGGATPAAAASGGAKASAALPAFIANTTGPKPDFAAAGPLYEDGFSTYPKNAIKSVTTPPGSGGKMLAFAMNGTTIPPTPKDQNPAWQAVDKALNTDVDFIVITQADYQTKLATMMAGNDLADTIEIQGNVPNLAAFLNQAAADLTPYLAGDAGKDYPNLAAIPTFSWQNSGCVQNGKLVMVPVERYYPGNTFLRNTNMYDKEIGASYAPKDSDDWKRVLTQLNKPSAGRYATGSYNGGAYGLAMYAAMFGAPNNWSLGSDGKLVKDVEAAQYKEAVGYVRDLVASNFYHPDTATNNDTTSARNGFLASKWAVYVEVFGMSWQDALTRGPSLAQPVLPATLPPFAAHAGQKPQLFFGRGYFSTTMLKKGTPERIKEVLRILNFMAAPFGSQEDLLLTFGVPDVDYKLDASGTPQPTQRSAADASAVPWKYLTQRPQVAFLAGVPDYAKAATDFEKAAIPFGVADPTLGFSSP